MGLQHNFLTGRRLQVHALRSGATAEHVAVEQVVSRWQYQHNGTIRSGLAMELDACRVELLI